MKAKPTSPLRVAILVLAGCSTRPTSPADQSGGAPGAAGGQAQGGSGGASLGGGSGRAGSGGANEGGATTGGGGAQPGPSDGGSGSGDGPTVCIGPTVYEILPCAPRVLVPTPVPRLVVHGH